MDGAKNSFIITSFPNENSEILYRTHIGGMSFAENAVHLCKEHNLDGAVFLKNYSESAPHYEWDFYNADGSVAEMCGNAARCVAAFTAELKLAPKEHSFKTIAGNIKAKYLCEGKTQVQTHLVSKKILEESLSVAGGQITFYSVNSGVPHAVIPVRQLKPEKFKSAAQDLRSHSHFGLKGTNVSFYEVNSQDQITAISFERGVEDYTEACGTGAVATAFVHHKINKSGNKVKVQMPGGLLEIDFNDEDPWLIGPVRYI